MSKEKDIEEKFIKKLTDSNKYVYRKDIRDRDSLERNFREKFESLNKVKLTDSEFDRLLDQIISNDVFKCSEILRNTNYFEREDGTPLHYTLVNTKDWCKNSFEVVNQLKINTKNSFQRYDVILLINGLPLVQIELKSLYVSPRKAIEQIIRYKNDAGNGYSNTLLSFMQIFIVSNVINTFYFSNNLNKHFVFNADERFLPVYYFAEKSNKKITNLYEFTEKFLSKCTLAEMISKYMVLIQNEKKIMIMRPYQIYAVEEIVKCIEQNRGNGYIWHTTGSGKTLTSFKASTLLKNNPNIEKCLFVVDRKDLDRQTREEFNRFQPGCVEENTNTKSLVKKLLSTDYKDKVIVTTIQKLGLALDGKNKNKFRDMLKPLSNKRIVFIFDECHRSQFGENHKAIREFFPNAQLFGFTGTPIFEQNAIYKRIEGRQAHMLTTEDVFEKKLHSYTITHAIEDNNVLSFHVEYYKKESSEPVKPGETLEKKAIIEAILKKHNSATNNRKFNALFATASINDAIEYYHLFKKIQEEKQKQDEDFIPLNIACIFSPPADVSSDVAQFQEDLPQEFEDNKKEPNKKKEALSEIINDYNERYKTNFDVYTFDLYYQDVQKRIKDQKYPNSELSADKKIDITIVVDMLLTGFDSKYLNTLYVDKNLKYHSLIQAFSRTNRVLNDSKPYGNIIDFRGQKNAVDTAIIMFSGEESEIDKKRAREIWLVEPAPKVIESLEKRTEELKEFMKSQGLEFKPEDVINIKGDEAKVIFMEKFKEIQRLKTRLNQYTDLNEEQRQKIDKILSEESHIGFKGMYLELAKELKEKQETDKSGEGSLQQLDFEFVLFDSALIDYDYIMKLITKYLENIKPKKQKMTRDQLINLIASSARLMDEREDLIEYVNTLKEGQKLKEDEIRKGYEEFKAQKFEKTTKEIADKHDLEHQKLKSFIDFVMDRMIFDVDKLSELFESKNLNWKERAKRENSLMKDLIPIFKKLAQGQEISGLEVYYEE